MSTDVLDEDPTSAALADEEAPPLGVEDESVADAVVGPARVTGSVVTVAAVRLRAQPATTARTLRSVAAGSRLALAGGSASGWTQVRALDGAVGWIVASALRPA